LQILLIVNESELQWRGRRVIGRARVEKFLTDVGRQQKLGERDCWRNNWNFSLSQLKNKCAIWKLSTV